MSEPAAPATVVLLGGAENALSVARSLDRRGARVIALGDSASPLRHSRRRVAFHRADGDSQADDWLRWLRDDAAPGMLVFPCCDEALELVGRHRDELASRGLVPLEADDRAVANVLDKQTAYEIARRAGIATPRTARLGSWPEVAAAASEIGFPCALKPVHIHEFRQHFRRKVIVVRDLAALHAAFARTSELGVAMILTEIIPGAEDRYCSYFTYVDERGAPMFHFTKRKLRQYPVGFGGGTYHLVEWADDVAEQGWRFVQAAGLRGLANTEFKRDPRDGLLKLIECNARFTGGNEIVRLAGVDLAAIAYARMTGAVPPPVHGQRDGVRMWYPVEDTLAFLEARRTGDLTALGWLAGLLHHQRFPVWSVTDPLPSILAAGRTPARALRKLLSRGSAERSSSPEAVVQ
ncbi:MAG TPA: ATP-grasp domain-containing protein [Gaiellales bacterium]|nr:ATP-grasp domain-containing protein [Gaiellales bacterium]